MLHDVVLVSIIQLNESAIYVHITPLFKKISYLFRSLQSIE